MPSGSSSKHHSSSSSSSKKHHSSSSSSKHHIQSSDSGSSSEYHPKGDDWSDVTEPDERRRIQNRIAQRKFREKSREQKETQDREARDRKMAGAAYSVPLATDLADEDHLSGLPWGGLNMPHMVQRDYASSRHGASDQYDMQGQQQYYDPQMAAYGSVGMSYGDGGYDMSGAAGDRYFTASSAASSSPSYFSYDAFSVDGGSQGGSRARQ